MMIVGCILRFLLGLAGSEPSSRNLEPKFPRRLRGPLTTTGLPSVEDMDSVDKRRGGLCADIEVAAGSEVLIFDVDALEPLARGLVLDTDGLLARRNKYTRQDG